MAKILTKNSVTAGSTPSGLSFGELAVNITDKKIFIGNAVQGVVTLHDQQNVVTSINGSTGAVTNVARINEGNTFSVLQVMNAGITTANLYVSGGSTFSTIYASSTTNTIDAIASTDGIGLRVARSVGGGPSSIGGILFGRSSISEYNYLLYTSTGTFYVINGTGPAASQLMTLNSVDANFNVPIRGATFSSTAGRITVQKSGAGVGGESAVVRIVGTDVVNTAYNSDIRANASAAADTTHTLPAVTGTLLNTASSYVISVNGSTGAVTIATGLSWSAVTTDRSLVAEEGVLANKSSGTLTLTLPTTATLGKVIRVSGMQNTWRIAQNASQKIHFGKVTTTTGAGGYLESSNAKDAVELVCCVANLEWNVISSIGNITIV